ncbi:PaaI family thioesterase [Roseiarcus sp.]|uniref:PaaI family thioesterase n=1 Tax=Roseiarcus sp. TaxID=1969460 RepID=UPI003F9CB385
MEWGPDQKFGVASREETVRLTGRQILQGMIDGRLPAPPISRTLSFRPVEVGDGFAVFEGEPGPDLLNPLGSVHGGWALALIESATAAAVHSTLPAGASFATVETKGNFTRLIVPETGRVRAEGRVVNAGRTIVSAEARIIDGRGRLMAHGTSTVMVFRDIRD